jgi:hypothetical protein
MTRYLLIEPLHILLSRGLVYEIDALNPRMRRDLTFVPTPEVGTVSSPCSGSSELFHVDA